MQIPSSVAAGEIVLRGMLRKEVCRMPPQYRHYRVLDEFVFSSEEDQRKGIYKAVQLVKPTDGPVEIRVCYYTKRRRGDGSEWWGLSPRPAHFLPEEAQSIAKGISELAEKFMLIADSAGAR